MLRRLCTNVARSLVAPATMCLAQFALVAICLATWPLQFLSLLGTSLPVTLALISALALGFAAGARRFGPVSRASIAGFSSAVLLNFALAAWMVASPWLVQLTDWTISQPGVIRLSSPGWNATVLFGLALASLGFPAFVAAQLAVNVEPSASGRSRLPLVFLGAAAGLFAWSAGLAQILGPYYCGLAAAGTGLVCAAIQSFRKSRAARLDAPGNARCLSEVEPIASSDDLPASSVLGALAAGLLALVCGGWIAALDRLIVQLSPGSIYLSCA